MSAPPAIPPSPPTYIYVSALTSQPSLPTPLRAIVTLLSSPATNPRVVSLSTQVYPCHTSGPWSTVSETAELLPAASAYYYIVGDGKPSERPVMLSDISRMMDEGEMDGMSM
eukprot:CAMPEP_0197569372 /NCGR_PEP_ID=MMETSP1320-20131121/38882_1 /TAXON_ID=91990 /ORGANISM="Bolidomonas sp., Strain RCC2347" /LENGTH=111 /DNA_ID=CAMNT_0043131727 /DNA_START=85 /DNA_END=417 /DNA_ORIENTATION=+